MNQQELQAMRSMIAAHKRWDLMFGAFGHPCSDACVDDFCGFVRRHGGQWPGAHRYGFFDLISIATGSECRDPLGLGRFGTGYAGNGLRRCVPLAWLQGCILKSTLRKTG